MPGVLIADDDYGIRYLLRMVFAHRGHDVFVAENGREAINLFRQHRPAIAILDLHMPGMDKFEAMREMHSLNPAACIIILTGADAEAVRSQVKDFRVCEVFQKGAWP